MVPLFKHKVFSLSHLPIQAVMPALLEAVREHSQIILKAATGAGKSTHFPMQLLRQSWVEGRIVMLEPRRLAAKNIAHYIAGQLGESVGESVGYRIRGESKVSAKTKLEIVTEGIMTRLIQSDPELTGIDIILFDEFHERSIHADTALAFGLDVQNALRDDLKIIVMSATLDHASLQQLLPDARYVESQGRQFPVDIRYVPVGVNEYYLNQMAKQIERLIHSHDGSLLAFLPGVSAIRQLEQRLSHLPSTIQCLPLYGQLPFDRQQAAIAPSPKGVQKIVLATNIAETSLTIEGITMVVDSGLERVARFDLRSGITHLEQVRIAQSSAEQRTGRAGRIEAGYCVRLYSEAQFQGSEKVPEPEILHSDLSALSLELIQWGASDPNQLAWLDVPPPSALSQAQQLLQRLGLIDAHCQPTLLGKASQKLGTEPRFSAMLQQCQKLSQQQEGGYGTAWLDTACIAVALIEEAEKSTLNLHDSLYRFENRKHSKQRIVQHRASSLARQLEHRFDERNIDASLIAICLGFAFPDRIAQQRKKSPGQFILAKGQGATIAEDQPLANSDYLICIDLMRTHQHTNQVFLAIEFSLPDIEQYHSALIKEHTRCDWDDEKGRLVAQKEVRLDQLILRSQPINVTDNTLLSNALLNYVRRKGIQILNWNVSAEQLATRVQCAKEWLPEQPWPDLSEVGLMENLDDWLSPYLSSVKSAKALKTLDVEKMLSAYLGWPLNQEIDKWLPTHWNVPTGSRKAITYEVGKSPLLSVRMQEMFGEKTSPTIAQGRVNVVLELLSPAQRPLQLTQDLAGFWQGSYKEVQKEMKGRYPKHPWPDDPANHIATTKTKRQMNR